MVVQEEYLCNDCAEEFTLTHDDRLEMNYCPFCGADVFYHEDDWDDDEEYKL